MPMYFRILLLLAVILLSACATPYSRTTSPPLFKTTNTAELQSLSSSISLTLRSSEQSMAGSGYLLYKRPDMVHIVVLSPFGSILMEAYCQGQRLALVYPSEKIIFEGQLDELPSKGGLQEWRSVNWILQDVAASQRQLREKTSGEIGEKITIEQGEVVAKSKADGERVYYGSHAVVQGVMLAHELDLRNGKDDQLRIVLEEPEINLPLEDSAFIPPRVGMKIYPFSALQQ